MHTLHIAAEAPPTDDVMVIPPIKTDVTTPASTHLSIHTDGGFLVGLVTLLFS